MMDWIGLGCGAVVLVWTVWLVAGVVGLAIAVWRDGA